MPVTLSSPPSASLSFSGLPASPKRLPQASTPTNPVRFGMDTERGQDNIELAQRRMEEGTFTEVPLDDTPRAFESRRQSRRHGLDLRRDVPPQNTAPANEQPAEQQSDSEPETPSIPSRLRIAATGIFSTAVAGIGGSLAAKGVDIFQDSEQYTEPEGLVKTAGIATSVLGVGAVAAGTLLLKRAFSMYSDRKEALQAQAQQPSV